MRRCAKKEQEHYVPALFILNREAAYLWSTLNICEIRSRTLFE